MRKGFTTGSAAAAAAKASAYMLFSGKIKDSITIQTPADIEYQTKIVDIDIQKDYVSCAVIKDSGDDPDVTNGAKIVAKVIKKSDCGSEENENHQDNDQIIITAGEGIGIVTRPGLDQSVGSAAINSVPRQMIRNEVMQVLDLFDYKGKVIVQISVPEGAKLAKSTFNERLGIEGGISIIGTTGIVEPMSMQALKDTIYIELKQKVMLGNKTACICPGNYGRDFMLRHYDFDIEQCVKCSNFIGDTIDMILELGFEEMLLVGHIGKLIKVSGGIMNTHSREADCRMELLNAALIKTGVADNDIYQKVSDSLTTDEALMIIDQKGLLKDTMDVVMDKVMFYLNKRAKSKIRIECVIYSNEFGVLCKSVDAEKLIAKIR